jgi:hypothetical protein
MKNTGVEILEKKDVSSKKSTDGKRSSVEELIRINSQWVEKALHAQKEIAEDLLGNSGPIGPSPETMDTMRKVIHKNTEVAEESVKDIIEISNKHIILLHECNMRLMDALKESLSLNENMEESEALYKVVEDNFKVCVNVLLDSMKALGNAYDKHAESTITFNREFTEQVWAQLELFNEFHSHNLQTINKTIESWWIQDGRG